MRLLLDAGDGVSAGLLAKARKIDTVAVTHPDRDHLTGLFQLLQLNARAGLPRIAYPKDSGSFPAIEQFCQAFDPHVNAATWLPVAPGVDVPMSGGLALRVVPSSHIDRPGQVKSVGYQVVRRVRMLKPEYHGRTQPEMATLSAELGPDSLTEIHEQIELSYSGDTGVGSPEPWLGSRLLIHESTFLRHEDAGEREDRNQHSVLPDVVRMANDAQIRGLILSHFSSRYRPDEVLEAVRAECEATSPLFPVYVIPPGAIVRDLLAQSPVWPGRIDKRS
jgi:ribonuclease Z